ncbi:DUF2335 domain-containing protein [Halomonas citrativorans]|nr:DUF2335 domain-containing protein [Halomonas citrativorans]
MRSYEARSLTYSGPLPPSSEMERYESIMPGAADRILFMAEQQQKHRHDQEIAASVLGLGGVAAVAAVFIKVRSKQ